MSARAPGTPLAGLHRNDHQINGVGKGAADCFDTLLRPRLDDEQRREQAGRGAEHDERCAEDGVVQAQHDQREPGGEPERKRQHDDGAFHTRTLHHSQ